MKIKFKNGRILEVLQVNANSLYHMGASRDALSVVMDSKTDIEEVMEIVKENKDGHLTLVDNDNNLHIHDGYSLMVSLGIENEEIKKQTSTEAGVYDSRLKLVLAQKTYVEMQTDALIEERKAYAESTHIKEIKEQEKTIKALKNKLVETQMAIAETFEKQEDNKQEVEKLLKNIKSEMKKNGGEK